MPATAALLLILGSGLLGACSSPTADPYDADIAAARQRATSEFERGVLSDGRITPDEYAEANQRWLACMHQTYPPGSGVDVRLRFRGDGLFEYEAGGLSDEETQRYDQASDACQRGTIAVLGTLYNDMTMNPQRLSADEILIACLKRNGVVPDSYTVDNWRADHGGLEVVEQGSDGEAAQGAAAPVDPSKVTGLDVGSPGVQRCLSDPSASGTAGG